MITERLMAAGAWDLKLKPDTPRAIMDLLDVRRQGVGFGQIVITPTPVDPNALSDANVLTLARYTGIYRKQPSELGLAGAGVNILTADEEGKGTYFSSLSTAGGTFVQWAAAVKPAFLTAGVVSTVAGTYTNTYLRTDLRQPLKDLVDRFGVEWRVTNDFKFDIGTIADMYRATPIAVVVRNAGDGGRDLNILGLVGDVSVERDLEDWARRVRFLSGAGPTVTTADGSVADIDVPYRAPDGSAAVLDRKVQAPSDVPAGSEATMAAAEWTKGNVTHQELSLSTRQYDIGQDVRIGDNLYVHDPLRGIADTANPLTYRGQIIYPEILRCVGYRWPIRDGFGVYFRRMVKGVAANWTPAWTDLTNYVDFEDGATSVDVGSRPRPSS